MSYMGTINNNNYLKILIVTPYFYPENFKINDLANELIKKGHSLSVLAPIPNYPEGKYYKGFSLFKNRYQNFNGNKILRVPVIPRGSGGRINLFLNYFSYVIFSAIPVRKILYQKFDLIFVYAPSPATVGIPAIFLKKILKIPVIHWVHDLCPESVKSAGNLNSNLIPNLIKPIIKWLYQNSDRILVSSPGFVDVIADKGIDVRKIDFLPQCAEPIFKPVKKDNKFFDKKISENSFKIMFAGNIGEAQDFPAILNAAKILKYKKNIQWIIISVYTMTN